MKKEKTKTRKIILTSGLTWFLLLEIARSHKKLKLEGTLEKYILEIAYQFFDGVLWIGGTFVVSVALMFAFGNSPRVIIVMAIIFISITATLLIFNGIKAKLTITEAAKLAYIHIRKTLFIRR